MLVMTKDLTVDSLQYGRVNEEIAIIQYENEMECNVTRPVGLVVHKNYPFLAATPDGLINDDLILEVKCPKVAEKRTVASLAKGDEKLKTFFFWTKT